jgi:hypothetical protein
MSVPYRSKPSLDNAFARLDRAKEHLTRLDDELEKALRGGVAIGSGLSGLFRVTVYPLPKIIPILIGETVFNLRSSLDSLIFQLAFLDTGEVQKGTKFPIEDNANAWQTHILGTGTRKMGRWKVWLPLLTPAHLAAIERLQPFTGCEWTRTLRILSNPDRHCELTVVEPRLLRGLAADAVIHDPAGPPQSAELIRADARQGAVVVFDGGPPVMRTLERLQSETAATLNNFNRDFL